MKQMLSDIELGQEFLSFFFVPETPQIRQNKKQKDYLCLKLQDKSDCVDGRLWEYPLGFNPALIKKGSYIKIKGSLSEWNGEKQVSIAQIRLAEESDALDIGDFFERSQTDPIEMLHELTQLIFQEVTNDKLNLLLRKTINKNKNNLLLAPAAKSVHHAYLGGLLEHILSMSKVAIRICDHYKLNKSLVIAACVLHDIGKLVELTYPVGIGFSVEGTLLGHICIGMELVAKEIDEIPDFPEDMRLSILHLIASHHGLLEYGSPKVPLMREALIFNLIDMMDAKNAMCDRAIKKGLNEEGMTDWVKEFSGPLYVLKED
jgi:3'-5' exoribonuclease